MGHNKRKNIAIIGAGIAGLSAAWLLSKDHSVTVYEVGARIGGHANTVLVTHGPDSFAIDTGFIVYNELTYPNLTALFQHLAVTTCESDMSFAVSLRSGQLEYCGTSLSGLFAQKSNLLRPRFLAMLRDLIHFYRHCPAVLPTLDPDVSLGELLETRGYGPALLEDHLLPMAAAIWSAEPCQLLHYPARAFIEFFVTHQLCNLSRRVTWRTVKGGSRTYLEALTRNFRNNIRLNSSISRIERRVDGVVIHDHFHGIARYDEVILGTHANQALALLSDATAQEQLFLGAFRYSRNRAVLHCDPRLMPQRRSVWSSWNFMSHAAMASARPCITYWMNRLQKLTTAPPLFVTLNPIIEPDAPLNEEVYEHPLFDGNAIRSQEALWSLQGQRHTWYCGSYFGSGFHEDGLQSGLAVAELLGGGKRPWRVANESGRIRVAAVAPVTSYGRAA